MATLYYNAAVDTDWDELGNWWTNAGLSTQATTLPTSSDDVILTGSVVTNTGGALEVNTLAMIAVSGGYALGVDITISGGGYSGVFTNSYIGAAATVTGNCEFIGSQAGAVGAASNSGTITGNALFTGDVGVLPCVVAAPVENIGTVSGNAVFNGNSRNASTGTVTGSCTFSDNSYNDGTVNAGLTTYNGFTGGTCAGAFVILGEQASGLDGTGRGTYAVDGLFYTAYPTLAEGYDNIAGVYYFAGVVTTLDSSGNGYNVSDSLYYIAGVSTAGALDSAGTGFYDGHAYLNGTAQPTGWNSLFYYIDDVETTLDSNGTGIWETRNYVSGVSLGEPGTDKRWLLYTAGVSDPLDWHLSSNWLSYSTDWEGGAGGEAGAIPTAVDNVRINGACPKYDSNVSATCDVLSVTTVDSFDYWESSAIACTTADISGINRLVINAATSISVTGTGVNYGSLTGPTTFYNTASNATENYDSAYHKGICNSATTFRDTSSNGGTLVPDGTAYGAYHLAIVVGTASFRDSSTNVGWCGDAVFYDSAKNMLGIQGTSTLSYGQGINGTGILGTL